MMGKPLMQNSLIVLAVGLISVLLWADPYSRGRIGADYAIFTPDFKEVPLHPWQIGASVILTLLLVAGLTATLRRARRFGAFAFATEAAAFVVLNLIYVARDGVLTRATLGDEGAMGPGLLTLLGLAVRVAVLIALSQPRHVKP
jgi:hypothetical protein